MKSRTHAWFSKVPLIWGQYVSWWHAEGICYSLRIFLRPATRWQSGGCWREHQTPAFSFTGFPRAIVRATWVQMNFVLGCHKSLFSTCKVEKIAPKYSEDEKVVDPCKDLVDTATLANLQLSQHNFWRWSYHLENWWSYWLETSSIYFELYIELTLLFTSRMGIELRWNVFSRETGSVLSISDSSDPSHSTLGQHETPLVFPMWLFMTSAPIYAHTGLCPAPELIAFWRVLVKQVEPICGKKLLPHFSAVSCHPSIGGPKTS